MFWVRACIPTQPYIIKGGSIIMKIDYVRVSAGDQNTDMQMNAPCPQIFKYYKSC